MKLPIPAIEREEDHEAEAEEGDDLVVDARRTNPGRRRRRRRWRSCAIRMREEMTVRAVCAALLHRPEVYKGPDRQRPSQHLRFAIKLTCRRDEHL